MIAGQEVPGVGWGSPGWAGFRLSLLFFPEWGQIRLLVLFFSLCFPKSCWSFEQGRLLGTVVNWGLIRGTESIQPGVWGFGRKREGSWLSGASMC